MTLDLYLQQIESYIPQLEQVDKSVSQVNVGWQLDHCLTVIIKVSRAIEQSKPADYQAKFHLAYELLNLFYWIPRGKGRSPKSVLPDSNITKESLSAKLKQAKEEVSKLSDLPPYKYFEHPVFGNLKKKRAIRFMGMHTQHHLKIVKDILA